MPSHLLGKVHAIHLVGKVYADGSLLTIFTRMCACSVAPDYSFSPWLLLHLCSVFNHQQHEADRCKSRVCQIILELLEGQL